MKKLTILFLLAYLILFNLKANNLTISNAQIASINSTDNYAMIRTNITWDNSWRDTENWDAVWVFMKYRASNGTDAWQHATLNFINGVSDGHSSPTGCTINTSSDSKGVFIYRSENGSGNIQFSNIQLRWNFGTDGLTSLDNIDVKIFGIEMVYVPLGSFYVGDGQTDSDEIYGNFEEGTTGNAFQITSENAITLGGGQTGSLGNNNKVNHFFRGSYDGAVDCSNDGCLDGSGDDFDDSNSQNLPQAFPKGFDSFYCMKYELTQLQFVDMLNCLTTTQQTTLTSQATFVGGGNTMTGLRYGISSQNNVFTTTEPHAPMIYCDWILAASYADWSGLRPMTELEFEKAARGTNEPVVNEYAWGNASIYLDENLTLSNQSAANEEIASGYHISTNSGNCWINGGNHNMSTIARVGIFAANASNYGRISSGASYYGIMELSGNAWERTVSVGHSEGRKFTGNHGDGTLDINGYANTSDWPGTLNGTSVSTNIGVGYRGGGLAYPSPNTERNARISSRRLASGYWNIVIHDDGARFVRNAPF
jgi:formylglycine-generating enzyme required for sulfatase activity